MSRSFRETYLGRPFKAVRGWPQGLNKNLVRKVRYKLNGLTDEDGTPDVPATGYKKWRHYVGHHHWTEAMKESSKIIFRNGRKFLVKK